MMCNNPKLDLVNMIECIKFGKILSICSQDIEWKGIAGRKQTAGGNETTQPNIAQSFSKWGYYEQSLC